jgi:hypothetical protein
MYHKRHFSLIWEIHNCFELGQGMKFSENSYHRIVDKSTESADAIQLTVDNGIKGIFQG